MSEEKTVKSDPRLSKASATETRGERSQEDHSRTDQDGTALSQSERRKMLRAEWAQEVLPTPPKVNGWHYCWLSTTNATDPIYKRMQRGYEPVKASEVPGFNQYKVDGGEFEGCVACNEMLLFKIPEDVYQEVMSYFHHELPMEEEELLKSNAAPEGEDSHGRGLGQREGFDSLAKRVPVSTYE